MPEIARLSGCNDWLNLGFVERERTPRPLMKLGIRLHLAGLSLSNTVSELENFGVDRSRKAVHDSHGHRNAVERVYREVKRRTSSFSNTFSHVEPETAENWLLAHARWHNSRN